MSSKRLQRLTEAWRQQGAARWARWIAYRLANRLVNALSNRGVRRLLCLVDWANGTALRSCLPCGWTDLGRLVTFADGPCRAVFGPQAASQRGITFGCRAPATVLYSPLSQRPLSQRNSRLESRT